MEDLEGKLSAVLANPQMMQQIMELARSFQPSAPEDAPPSPDIPPADTAMLGQMMSLVRNFTPDADQQALISALTPYLPHNRLQKLRKAMQAARLAASASGFLKANSIPGG